MKKIKNYQDALEVFKQFLKDKNIIQNARRLFKQVDCKKLPNIFAEANNKKIKMGDLFLGNPKKLEQIVEIIQRNRDELDALLKEVKEAKKIKKADKIPADIKSYYELFNFFENSYNSFSSKNGRYAYNYTNKLGIKACPYCNMNSTDTVENFLRPPIDHFYPKEKFPFLAISFFNLIPACNDCNSYIKKEKYQKGLRSPYVYDFHNHAKFTISLMNGDDVHYDALLSDINAFKLELAGRKDCDNSYKIQKDFFKLEPRYSERKGHVVNIIERYNHSTPYLIDEVTRTTLGIPENIIKSCILSGDVDAININKRPYIKLEIDLLELLSDDLKKKV